MRAVGDDEIAALRLLHAARSSRKAMARALNLDPVQVGLLVRGLGLVRPASATGEASGAASGLGRGAGNVARLDAAFVRRYWHEASSRDIGRALNVRHTAVAAMARRLGLPPHGPHWRPLQCPLPPCGLLVAARAAGGAAPPGPGEGVAA
jgi:hypothetical protein